MNNSSYKSAIYKSPVGFAYHKIILDESGKPVDYQFVEVNPAFEQLTGLKANKIIGKTVLEILPGLSQDNFDWIGFYGNIALNGGNKHFHQYSEPLNHWYNVRAFSDEKYYFTTLVSEVTPVNNTTQNKESNTSSSNYRELVENLNEVVYKLNHKAEIIYISPNVDMISGYSAEYLTGRSFIDLVHPEDKEDRIDNFKKALAGYNNPTEYRFLTKSGQIAWVQTNARPIIKNNKPIGIQGVLTDITKRKEIEQELEESKNKFKNQTNRLSALLASLPGGVLIETPQREVLFVNQNFCDLFNIEAPADKLASTDFQSISETPRKLFVNENEYIANIEKTEQKHQSSALKEEIELKDGRFFERDFVPVEVESGEYEYLWHYREITDRKKAEEHIQQANKELKKAKLQAEESDKLKSAFLANMSHEIRTPMNAVVGFSNIIQEENLDKEEIREYAEIISNSGNHLLHLINDIIDLAKIDAGELSISPEVININDLMDELYYMFDQQLREEGKQHIKLTYKTPQKPVFATTDKTRLRQILINLLRNAVKFINTGSIEFGYEKHDTYLKFYVQDTGIGIDENQIERIFDRFNQASDSKEKKYGGAGLGLSISKACAKLLGGSIWVDSKPGEGTTFFFTIEYKPGQKQQLTIEKEKTGLPVFHKQHVLIAEDDDLNFQYFKAILKYINLKISRAVSGKQTLEMIKNNPDIKLILMDIQMPDPNGIEVTRQLRNEKYNIPIIIQTAYAFSSDRKESLSAGANEYISKPIAKTELYKLLDKYLS